MPKYLYRCESCEDEFFAFHMISEKLENCNKCVLSGTLRKVPSNFSLNKKHEKTKKIGDEVKAVIEEVKFDLEKDKLKLRNDDWESND